MKNLEEINQLLAEIEGELVQHDARRAELLKKINELQQAKNPFLRPGI